MSEYQYKDEPKCKICSSKDPAGNRIRDLIDAYASKGHTHLEIQEMLKEKFGLNVSLGSISNHYKKHSPLVKQAKMTIASKPGRKLIAHLTQEMVEASGAIQRIINIGDEMVQNWIDNKEGPKMPVSERLYIEALKEEGRRGIKTTLDVELEEMDEGLFLDAKDIT